MASIVSFIQVLLNIFQIFLIVHVRNVFSGEKPVLEMQPNINLIWYKSYNETSMKRYINELDNFFKPYYNSDHTENIEDCLNNKTPSPGKVCAFELNKQLLGPCSSDYNYGFSINSKSGPCVFLKLSQVPGWTPEYFTSNNLHRLLPDELKDQIRRNEQQQEHYFIWIYCQGETPTDQENIGPISYYPQRGLAGKYFPFRSIKGYRSPLVAVYFESPKYGSLINIECQAWAPNINNDKKTPWTTIHLELMVD